MSIYEDTDDTCGCRYCVYVSNKEPIDNAERAVIDAAIVWRKSFGAPAGYERQLANAVSALLKARGGGK
jgi:hypothetical protein